MTQTNTVPTPETNEPQSTEQPIDNMGNPVNPDGTPAEPQQKTEEKPSYEAIEKALKDTKAELTRVQQGQAQPKEEPKQEPPKEENKEPQSDLEIKEKEAEEKGVDFSKYSTEYNSNGGLSEASYEELDGLGYPRDMVDDYIAGKNARNAAQTAEVAEVVGGVDNLDSVLEWAGDNLSDEEINAYNTATQGGTEAAKLALQGLYSRYTAENGSNPRLVQGQAGTKTGEVFKSQFDLTKAMEDKRYWTDPDYQQEVMDKAKRSQKAGTI